MIFYIIELDQFAECSLGNFNFANTLMLNSIKAHTTYEWILPLEIKDLSDLENYTLVYLGIL